MSFDTVLADLQDPTKRPSATQLASFSDLAPDEVTELSEAWPEIETGRRLSLLNQLATLAEDNVELNYDAIFKLAITDDDPYIRAAAVLGLSEYEGRDLIPPLIDLLLSDDDAEVRRQAAIALGRYA